MAVLKVLGFQPRHVMGMVLGEAVLIGVYGGMLSTWSVVLPAADHQLGERGRSRQLHVLRQHGLPAR